MEKFSLFYNWFTNLNGIISETVDINVICDRLQVIDLKHSSFKNRAAEVKSNFNYKFN